MSVFKKEMEDYVKYPSGVHEKLFVALGNGYEADKIGATGAIVFAHFGFTGNEISLGEYLERERVQPSGLDVRVCANGDLIKMFPSEKLVSFEEIDSHRIHNDYDGLLFEQLTLMANKGHRIIAITPLRTFDGTLGRDNDEKALQTLKRWLENGGAEKVDKVVYMSMR